MPADMLQFTCDICDATQEVSRMKERELIGKQRQICRDCHEYLEDTLG